MRHLLLGLSMAIATIPAQSLQSSLSTSYTTNYYLHSADGGVYFDLQVQNELQLQAIDLNLLATVGAPGSLEVFVRPGTWFGNVQGIGDWVQAATGTWNAAGSGLPTTCTLTQPIGLPPGSYGVALHIRGGMPLYNFAFGPRSYACSDLRIVCGGSAVQFLQSAPYFYRVFSGALHYSLGGGPFHAATAAPYGEGCRQGARSFYELFSPGTFDLTQQRIVLTPNGTGGYDVSRTPGVSIAVPVGATNLGLSRQVGAFVHLPAPLSFPGGTTSTLLVQADGRVLLTDEGLVTAPPAGPAVPTLFTGAASVAAAWLDLDPAGSDNVYVHSDPATGATSIVWWNVPVFGAPNDPRATFAVVVLPSGVLELHCGAVANPSLPCLVGFGAGYGARDPGPRDLSSGSFATQSDDPGLGLRSTGRPVLGTTTTLRVVDIAAGSPAVVLLGWQPLSGIDLSPFGAPGCRLFVDPGAGACFGLGAARTLDCVLPGDQDLLGLGFQAQAFGLGGSLLASNAIGLTIGSV
jgi:hypothetical protein